MLESGSLSLRLKLSAIVVVVIAGVMGAFGYVAVEHQKRLATEEAVRQLAATNRLIRDLVMTNQDGMRIAVGKLGAALQTQLHGHFALAAGQRIERDGVATPRLSLDGRPLNFDYRDIDRFSRDSGGNVATVFARDGEDFVRVSTSLLKEDGSRAVGTRLGRDHPAYRLLLAGKPYQGHARLFGGYYMTEYRPIADSAGRVIGVLFVGMDLGPSLDALRQKLRQFVIGASGYVVVIDAAPGPAQGQLLVHPSKEGSGLRAGQPSAEARVIDTALRQRNGTLFYDWGNREKGESEPRHKVAALDEYPDLGWIIVSTGYLDEFTHTAVAGQGYLLAATGIASLLLIVVLNLSIGRLVLLPLWREIGERKHAQRALQESEARLRESEERYRLLLEHSPVGILHYDRDLVVDYGNHRFAEIMQLPHSRLLGLDCKKLEDLRVLPAQQSALAGECGYYEGPYRSSHAGVDLFIAMNCAPVRDAAGAIAGGIAIVQDITQRKITDREIELYRDHLEDVVAERTADLVAARAEAERLARVKSEFLANMSHEIRTPLNGVLGMAQIGYRHSAGRAKSQEAFAQILNSGKLLLGIINDILDFSKIEAGKLQVEAVPVKLHQLLHEVLELVHARACAKGIGLHVQVAPGLPAACLGDPVRLQQVLLNLLANAVKFTEAGSVVLTAARRADRLLFEVRDTGIGMSGEEIARIYAPFEQADTSTTRRFGGTGLGLAISRRIVEVLGGEIRVESTPGVGSRFEVSLPCVEAEPVAASGAPPAAPASLPDQPLAGLAILVAEDNDINQLLMEENLLADGARPVIVGNGREAVERILRDGSDAFDIVLMDIQMPEMDGYEATRRIRELAPALPIVGQTAHAFAEEREKCLAAGMVDHIAKPFDPDALVAVIRRHVLAGNAGSGRPAVVGESCPLL